jgi:hypothetical protein
VIGGGADIRIYDNCDKTNNNLTCFHHSYYGPNGTTKRTDETKKYLGGTFEFKVKELEVIQLIFR